MDLLLFVDEGNADHDPGAGMPDRPRRIEVCKSAIADAGISFDLQAPPGASSEQLGRAHQPTYLQRLEAYCAGGGGWIDPDTPAGPRSFAVAARAAGACCAGVDAALRDNRRVFCLVRPPGHHATSDRAMGFCLINSVAVGAAHALSQGADRVMIVDFDVHHGNGTQEIFWSNAQVLYVSLHQWPWYPWVSGAISEIGEGDGEGFNVNVPLPQNCGDEVYLEAMDSLVAPIARRFRPEVILVSAGYDAHAEDHLSSQTVSSQGFGRMTAILSGLADDLCGGAVIFALEGGYNPDALAESVVETVRAMRGGGRRGDRPLVSGARLPDEHRSAIDGAIDFHADRWGLR